MISTASDRAIAGKIASQCNSRECWACKRPVESGVFAFGASGSDARWYPTREAAEAVTPHRFIIDVPASDLSTDDVIAWLEEVRPRIEDLIDAMWRDREAKRAARELKRAGEAFASNIACFSCGAPKQSPDERCYQCGDEPLPHNADAHDFNRAYGFAS